MRVALDGTPLSVPTGGIRRYTIELARALTAAYPSDTYRLISDQAEVPAGWLARRWWMFGLNAELSRWGADLFHGTDFAVPYLGSRPTVLTLHDLSPWWEREAHSSRVRRRAPFLIRRIATMIVTPSEAIRREAIGHFRLAPDRVVAVPLAAGSHFRCVQSHSERKPYFLHLGAIEPRKNIGFLLSVWREIRQSIDAELLLAGRARAGFVIPNEPGIRVLDAVEEDALPALYSGAIACLYPSLYEGFGLPVLEAMQCGTPVIASTDPAISEVAGGAALLLDPHDSKSWAEAMRHAAANKQWREEMRARGLTRAGEFSWEHTARLTHEVYEEAVRRCAF